MKYALKALVLAMVVLLLVPRVVSADDYTTDAIEALKESSVYIAPQVIGTGNVDNDTAGRLRTVLQSDDNIVLVMLPADAMTGTDIYSLAQKLSEGLGNQKIIGLAVGKEVVGYGPSLPSGVASDQMRRAGSVSNDPVTALYTFAKNMHIWQTAHPQPTPTPRPTPIPLPTTDHETTFPWLWLVLGGVGLVIVVLALIARSRVRAAMIMSKRVRDFKPVETLIQSVQENVERVRDARVRGELASACLVAQGLLESLLQSPKPQGYTEEKFPELIENLDLQVRALLGHESGKRPMPLDVLKQLKDGLLIYDDLFMGLQSGDPESVKLMASIIDTNNTTIQTLGYLPKDRQVK